MDEGKSYLIICGLTFLRGKIITVKVSLSHVYRPHHFQLVLDVIVIAATQQNHPLFSELTCRYLTGIFSWLKESFAAFLILSFWEKWRALCSWWIMEFI